MLNQLLISSVFLRAILSFLLGIFSLAKNPRSFTVKLWFLVTIIITLTDLFFWTSLIVDSVSGVVFYSKLIHFVLAFLPAFFLHFVLEFTHQRVPNKRIILAVGYILASIIAAASLTEQFILGASPKAGIPLVLDPGLLYPLFMAYLVSYSLIGMIFLFRGYVRSDGILRKKFFWVLVGNLVAFLTGTTGYLPQISNIFPFGYLIGWTYPILITYGIFIDEIKIKIKF